MRSLLERLKSEHTNTSIDSQAETEIMPCSPLGKELGYDYPGSFLYPLIALKGWRDPELDVSCAVRPREKRAHKIKSLCIMRAA